MSYDSTHLLELKLEALLNYLNLNMEVDEKCVVRVVSKPFYAEIKAEGSGNRKGSSKATTHKLNGRKK